MPRRPITSYHGGGSSATAIIASFCPHARCRAQADRAPCLGLKVPPPPREQQRAWTQPLSHQGCAGHAELCSTATPDPLELIFIDNVSRDLRAQVRKCGNLLLGTPSRKHTSSDEIFQPLMTGRDEQMGTKSRGLFSVWAKPIRTFAQPGNKAIDLVQTRRVKWDYEFCISLLLQLFLIYDIIRH